MSGQQTDPNAEVVTPTELARGVGWSLGPGVPPVGRRRGSRVVAVIGVVLALLLSGCGDDGANGDTAADLDDAAVFAEMADAIDHVLVVWLCNDQRCPIEDGDLAALSSSLDDDRDVIFHGYTDAAEQHAMFGEQLGSSVDVSELQSFIQVVLAPEVDPDEVVARYADAPGVDEIDVREFTLPPRGELVATGEIAIILCDDVACPRATDEQRDALRTQLEDDPDIGAVRFETPEEAHERLLADRDDLLWLETIDPAALPASFWVEVSDVDQVEDVAARYGDADGVDRVVPQTEFVPES